jgi:hypothetical protein
METLSTYYERPLDTSLAALVGSEIGDNQLTPCAIRVLCSAAFERYFTLMGKYGIFSLLSEKATLSSRVT